jgi:DNA-binding MurR/RpiR family transcriptional regulator
LCSVRELEEELHTSKSTIVRLAQALGYEGFAELKAEFLKSIRNGLDPIYRYKSHLENFENIDNTLEFIAQETVENTQRTLELNDPHQLREILQVIEGARHVYTMGLGISYYLSQLTAYLLNRVSIRAAAFSAGALSFSEQIIHLDKNDAIIAFSFPPYSEATIQAAAYAQEKHIPVISFTDKATSHIIQFSNHIIQVAVETVSISNSVMPVLTVIYGMVGQIGKDLKRKTLKTIKSLDHVRKEHAGKS